MISPRPEKKDPLIELLVILIGFGLAFLLALGAGWAWTAIWPSLPFWPIVYLSWIAIALCNRVGS